MVGLGEAQSVFLVDESETLAYGESLSRDLRSGGTVFLHGDLGAGKTTLTRGILRGFGYDGPIRSPTYTLVERYETDFLPVSHFDLYRMGDPGELEFLGVRDDIGPEKLCIVEWPERAQGWLGHRNLDIYITFSTQPYENTKKIGRQIQLKWHNHHT